MGGFLLSLVAIIGAYLRRFDKDFKAEDKQVLFLAVFTIIAICVVLAFLRG